VVVQAAIEVAKVGVLALGTQVAVPPDVEIDPADPVLLDQVRRQVGRAVGDDRDAALALRCRIDAHRHGPYAPWGSLGRIPWQVFIRSGAVLTGLVLLLFVDVHGVAFYIAWALIALAVVSELLATLVYWLASRRR
jgi:hypothetical protein